MMDGMMGWGMIVWAAVGILLIVLLIVIIVRLLKKKGGPRGRRGRGCPQS